MDLNGVIDFIESQDDDAFALTSYETSFEDDLWEERVEHAAVLQVALQFCDDIITRPANFAPAFKDTNIETVTEHQIEKRYARSNRSDDLDVIEGLISHYKKKDPRPSLIVVKSRGGLLTPVEALEPLIRIAYQKSKTGLKSAGLFSAEVMATGLPEESPISDLDDRVMNDIMRLFRKIMCHHEYFLFLEK
ncbi:hypothetical protein CAPTEDRAFT_214700 [Capitella teleta]|uniref:Uncharacterized protein n=1 Tax=Capitella teleta TaxID=283909 RepID=R7V1D6_CAPTE|nr:hypothetical protein CAPTEDRAFT_214700 [Capitella teleta]|eukprot:ELU12297.1 hypothetical protein CAPTEDRAFT_214700 [Capitella teleta]